MPSNLALKLVSPRIVLALNSFMILGMAVTLFRYPSRFSASAGTLFVFLAPVLTVYSYILKPPSKVFARISMGANIFMLVAGIGSTALWIAVVAVGIALVAIGRAKPGAAGRR